MPCANRLRPHVYAEINATLQRTLMSAVPTETVNTQRARTATARPALPERENVHHSIPNVLQAQGRTDGTQRQGRGQHERVRRWFE